MILEPPPGCIEIPGFILVIEPGRKWLTQNGQATTVFGERGIWETEEDAERARDVFFEGECGSS